MTTSILIGFAVACFLGAFQERKDTMRMIGFIVIGALFSYGGYWVWLEDPF